MPRRVLIAVLALALLAAPASYLLLHGPSSSKARVVVPAKRQHVAVADRGTPLPDTTCRDDALAYGVTDDYVAAKQFDRDFLSPFTPHPPIPARDFHAPNDPAGDGYALVHALYHGYAVVRYQPGLAERIDSELVPATHHRAIVVAARGLPWAFGAVVYGRQLTCRTLGASEARALASWLAKQAPAV